MSEAGQVIGVEGSASAMHEKPTSTNAAPINTILTVADESIKISNADFSMRDTRLGLV